MSTRHFTNDFEDQILNLSSINSSYFIEYSLGMLNTCIKGLPPIADNEDGGLYVGFIGLAYALLHISESPLLTDKRIQLLNQAKYFTEQQMHLYSLKKQLKTDTKLSFLLGNVGTLSVAVNVYQKLGLINEATQFATEFLALGDKFQPLEIYRTGSDELFVGKAGYLLAYSAIKLSCSKMSLELPKDKLYGILDSVVNSGQQYAVRERCRAPLMYSYYNTEYLGAGHGLAGILFALMKFPEYLNDRPAVVAMIQQCLDYMISITPANGNLPPGTDDIGRKGATDGQLTHWCHGAAGAIYAYARAYLLWHQEKYLEAAVKCGNVIWKYGLLKKGPGICHGIAGSGYAFLLLYRLTSDEIYLNRANCFANFLKTDIFKQSARVPDSPYSLFEGWAGTACFISDLAMPGNGSFPFFDIFN